MVNAVLSISDDEIVRIAKLVLEELKREFAHSFDIQLNPVPATFPDLRDADPSYFYMDESGDLWRFATNAQETGWGWFNEAGLLGQLRSGEDAGNFGPFVKGELNPYAPGTVHADFRDIPHGIAFAPESIPTGKYGYWVKLTKDVYGFGEFPNPASNRKQWGTGPDQLDISRYAPFVIL
jgi:hypothetical protein